MFDFTKWKTDSCVVYKKNPKKFKFGAKKNSGTQERYMKKIGEKKFTTIAQKLLKKAVSSNYTSPSRSFSTYFLLVIYKKNPKKFEFGAEKNLGTQER